MKAIETRYNGFRFRSRLEARWAVFFDKLGLPYEYEHEGFKLDSGVCYLPDFYLPEVGVYAEIKPNADLDSQDVKTFIEFSRTRPLLLIVGSPEHENMFLFSTHDMFSGCPCPCQFARSALTEKLTLTWTASRRIKDALASAKGARFEHGEREHA